MIPFEELCDALAAWRSRNGLATGTPMPREPVFVAVSTDEVASEQPTAVTASPLAARAAAPKADDPTGELDLDSLFVDDDT
jgi:hypothetical protein